MKRGGREREGKEFVNHKKVGGEKSLLKCLNTLREGEQNERSTGCKFELYGGKKKELLLL